MQASMPRIASSTLASIIYRPQMTPTTTAHRKDQRSRRRAIAATKSLRSERVRYSGEVSCAVDNELADQRPLQAAMALAQQGVFTVNARFTTGRYKFHRKYEQCHVNWI